MLSQKAIVGLVAGGLMIIAAGGTAFAAKSTIDNKEEMRVSISESLSSEEASIIEELKAATTAPTEVPATVAPETTSETAPPVTRRIPEITKAGETTSQKSAEELEAEYQEEYNYIMLSCEEKNAKYQSDMDRCIYPKELSANATQDEIDSYNQNYDGVAQKREMLQRCIDGEIQMRDFEINLLNERYGK